LALLAVVRSRHEHLAHTLPEEPETQPASVIPKSLDTQLANPDEPQTHLADPDEPQTHVADGETQQETPPPAQSVPLVDLRSPAEVAGVAADPGKAPAGDGKPVESPEDAPSPQDELAESGGEEDDEVSAEAPAEAPAEEKAPPKKETMAAIKKRLERLCKPKADGTLKVPKDVVADYHDLSKRHVVMSLFEKKSDYGEGTLYWALVSQKGSKKLLESADDDDVESDDGAAQSGVLKKVAFPDIQKEAQPATLCPKVTKCISKRLDNKRRRLTTSERAVLSRNAERDMHRRYCRLGLSIPVHVQSLDHTLRGQPKFDTHFTHVSEWMRVLLKMAPQSLFGDADPEQQCAAFWSLYEQHHPSHQVYQHRRGDLHRTLPILIFGDEGRGPKRGNFLIWTFETPFGLKDLEPTWSCGCTQALETLPESDITRCNFEREVPHDLLARASKQTTNYAGHSYLTKHLLFGIPHWKYKADKSPVHKHWEILAEDMSRLFHEGLEVN
ncbi:unnamed protein product, partial [Effrenium voratum]